MLGLGKQYTVHTVQITHRLSNSREIPGLLSKAPHSHKWLVKMLKSRGEDEGRQRCSEVTLQSEQRGHFGSFVAMVAASNPGCLDTFAKLETDEERVLFCTMLNKIDHMVVKPVFKPKSADVAKTKRNEGNEAFQKKRYKQAAMLYTVSAVKSPPTDDTLAYSVANRSASACSKNLKYL